jgi:hypothetical protein
MNDDPALDRKPGRMSDPSCSGTFNGLNSLNMVNMSLISKENEANLSL